jgi:outer membrane lipoprotein-sorting protein
MEDTAKCEGFLGDYQRIAVYCCNFPHHFPLYAAESIALAANATRIPHHAAITPSAGPCNRAGGGGATGVGHRYIRDMNRRLALLAPLAFLLPFPAAAEKISLAELSSYLNGLTTVEADFTQVNSDGSISTGKIYINRPGRVRFEYAPPDRSLVIAGGQQVAIFDAKSNQPPEQYPLKRTPLNLILAKDVNLGRAKMVVGHKDDGTSTRVTAQDPENPEYGTIELVFTDNPVELRQWVITDDLGAQTTVILGEMRKGGKMKASLFDITAETAKRGN